MKRTLVGLAVAVMVGGLAGSANAIPVEFNIDGGGSTITVTSTPNFGTANLTGALASGLGNDDFSLYDNESMEIDFFSLTSSGFGFGSYTVQATLAFTLPAIGPAVGTGGGEFFSGLTLRGIVSGGYLNWVTTPGTFSILGGPTINVEFEQGMAIVLGQTVVVHATITNLGGGPTGGATPVPEPNTLLLLGAGLVGLAVSSRRKARKN